jgi:hypothetical protein
MYFYHYVYVFRLLCMFCSVYSVFTVPSGTLFPCCFLSCKANSRVLFAKTGHGPHSSQLVNCVVLCIVCVDCDVPYIVCV